MSGPEAPRETDEQVSEDWGQNDSGSSGSGSDESSSDSREQDADAVREIFDNNS